MPTRLTLRDMRLSRLPEVVGKCQGDIPGLARCINEAQQRLINCKEVGDEGWNNTFAEMAFTMSRTSPYLTLPREVARLELATVCDQPITVNNQFAEYLQFGNGRLRNGRSQNCRWPITSAFSRNNVPTFVDVTNPPQNIHVYATDPADMDGTHRVLIQGLDNNNNTIYSQDGLVRVTGQYVTLASPFSVLTMPVNRITGIQKDITNGPVQFFQVDPSTGASILIHTMEPGETVASYRRYYFDSLPRNCCNGNGPANTVTVTAIAKLELIPAVVDTDYLLLTSSEAIIEECASVRYGQVDNPTSQQMSLAKHTQAVRFLVGELSHTQGIDLASISFKPFGSADLRRQNIGMQ
jgi:hypothetical protein